MYDTIYVSHENLPSQIPLRYFYFWYPWDIFIYPLYPLIFIYLDIIVVFFFFPFIRRQVYAPSIYIYIYIFFALVIYTFLLQL